MARHPRFLPPNKNGTLVEITCRTIGARALLVPSLRPRASSAAPQRFNEVVVGVLGRALEVSPLELCAAVVASNHLHLLATVQDQQQLSRFMQHLSGNLSKEIGRIREWRGALWERRYDAIAVSDEPEKQWERLAYLLRHGVKEGLVESPLEWPGVHAAGALVHGEALEGHWFHRTKEWAARRRGLEFGRYDFATRYLVHFAQLPAFRGLTPEEYQDRVAGLIREIEIAGEQKRQGDSVAGVEKILSQDPYEPPTRKTKRSPRPLYHCKDSEERRDYRELLRAFLAEYFAASDSLRADRRFSMARFPAGCYPPALPFSGEPSLPRPPSPPCRQLELDGCKVIARGEIPTISLPISPWAHPVSDLRARGQPSA